MNEIINAIPEYVITAVISTAFYFGVKEGQLLIRSKIQHAKTATARERWILTGQLAADAVNSLVGKDMAGHEKFAQATQIVQSALDRQGIKNVDLNAIETAIQAAYEKSPLTPTTISGTKLNSLEQEMPNFGPGTVEAIDPMKGDNQ
ncbi:phage holin, LLH family [Limosilactobacillus galli]|uniref:phage holin, LLH family n=1 Tax=Limosilactobacillus galli TaxID=2991834 RepID=UPI0024BB6988|nr:phage holin, LLH family [Limosilactobacillus galli]